MAARAKDPPTLLQRAVAALARREHSRTELARKLAHYQAAACDPAEIETVLDQLEAKGMLSDQRFATALARTRGERFGTTRIRQELRQHGIDPDLVRQATAALKQTEVERVRAVWRKKFGERPRDEAQRARQIRFLTARGFSADAILRVIKGEPDSGEAGNDS